MTELELVEQARAVLIRRLKIDPAAITSETNMEDLGADSLDLLTMASEFEQVFSVDISTKEIQQIRTFGDIVRQLSSKVGGAA
jgi:acyl carrier protein